MISILAKFEIVGKPEPRAYVNNDGKQAYSYKLNVAQNEGIDVATVSTTESVYNRLRRGDVAEFLCTYSEYDNRGVFRVADVSGTVTSVYGISSGAPVMNGASSVPPKK